ncbi:MAG TPA: hypothetical protein VFQ63_03225, partial [Patescibacteria group bacterium]|nr:hypothetical protein [Patescibacteria group bacterium]
MREIRNMLFPEGQPQRPALEAAGQTQPEQPTQETTRRRSFAEGVQGIRDALRFEFYNRPPLQPQEPQHRYGQSGLTYEVNQPQGWWGYLGAP